MASVSVEDEDGPGCLARLGAWLWVGRGARKEGRSIHEPGREKLTPKELGVRRPGFLPHSCNFLFDLRCLFWAMFSTSKSGDGWNQLFLRSLPVLTFFLTLSQTF